jgi:predicted transcriptional regulator
MEVQPMAVHAITLELPDEVYQRAQRVAQATRRPLEEVVSDWIRPPAQLQLPELDHLSDDELLQAARDRISLQHEQRLQELLDAQRRRTLSEDEQQEALSLVEQEDLLTLRKTRAIFLLKQRGILSDNLLLDR